MRRGAFRCFATSPEGHLAGVYAVKDVTLYAGSRLTAGGDAVCGALYLRMCVASCWAKIFGVPLGLAWRKFRSSRPSGTQYLRMCVVNAVGNIQGASRWAAKAHSQEWLCHVPSTSCWAKVFGVPLGLAWGKFRLSRTPGLIVPAYVRCGRSEEPQGACTWAEKAHSQEWLCHGQALEGADQGCGLRASMNAKMVMRRASAASRPSRITVAMVSGSGVAKQPQLICMPAA